MNEFNVLLAAAANGTPSGSLFDALFARYIAPQDSWRELESPLPITILAAGEDLIDYRIYGANGGVGEPTESGEPAGFKLPMVVRSRNLFDKDTYLVDGTLAPITTNDCYDHVIHLKANTTYVMSSDVPYVGGMNHLYVYSANYTDPYQIVYNNHPAKVRTGKDGCIYFRYATRQYYNQLLDGTYWVMLTEGSAAPAEYIPYYRNEENIYIGSDPLAKDEYVDFGKQKIYRMEGGTLTPTDPPAPIPALPTIQGETIIDYNPSETPAVEPEKMYIKYKPQ